MNTKSTRVSVYRWLEPKRKSDKRTQAKILKTIISELVTDHILVSVKYKFYAKNFKCNFKTLKLLIEKANSLPEGGQKQVRI